MSRSGLASGLKKWHDIVQMRDAEGLREILHEKVVFRSPVVHKPYHGKEAAFLLLSNVLRVFGSNFKYVRSWKNEEKLSCVLEFETEIAQDGTKTLGVHGVDIIEFDDLGKIVRFDVMIRPFSAASALKEAMGARLAKL